MRVLDHAVGEAEGPAVPFHPQPTPAEVPSDATNKCPLTRHPQICHPDWSVAEGRGPAVRLSLKQLLSGPNANPLPQPILKVKPVRNSP